MAVDAIGPLHRVEGRAVLGEDRAAVGDARVGDQDVEIVPGRLGELGLRVQQVHDPQVGRDARQNWSNTCARHVAALRQRPDAFEAVAEIRGRGADGGRLHQRMAGGAVFAGPFARRLALRRGGVCGGVVPVGAVRRREQRADIEALRRRRRGARDQHRSGNAAATDPRPCFMIHHRGLSAVSHRNSLLAVAMDLYGCAAVNGHNPRGIIHAPTHSFRSRTRRIMKPIRKAVFPVAGLGTRFLPATKAMPKEMLPVVDRPLIQHVVDEARQAGIEHFIFVTGRNKGVIEDHFDRPVRARDDLAGAQAHQGPGAAGAGPARRRHHELHAPAGAARPRPCGVVRARAGRQRAVRAAASRRAGEARARLPRADDRRRAGARRAPM